MSRKNHEVVGGRLLQTDKRFSDLKANQKEKINEWLYQGYKQIYAKINLPPDSWHNGVILDNARSKIEATGIWLPYYELEKYFISHKNQFRKRFEKESGE